MNRQRSQHASPAPRLATPTSLPAWRCSSRWVARGSPPSRSSATASGRPRSHALTPSRVRPEISSGAVRSSEIRDEGINVNDISTRARTDLRGALKVAEDERSRDADTCAGTDLSVCPNQLELQLTSAETSAPGGRRPDPDRRYPAGLPQDRRLPNQAGTGWSRPSCTSSWPSPSAKWARQAIRRGPRQTRPRTGAASSTPPPRAGGRCSTRYRSANLRAGSRRTSRSARS